MACTFIQTLILRQVEVLWIVPSDYNTSGGDMFWVHPALSRADGKEIPSVFGFGGGDARHFKGKEYCRWSRHWNSASWKPKTDNIHKVLDRIEWALKIRMRSDDRPPYYYIG